MNGSSPSFTVSDDTKLAMRTVGTTELPPFNFPIHSTVAISHLLTLAACYTRLTSQVVHLIHPPYHKVLLSDVFALELVPRGSRPPNGMAEVTKVHGGQETMFCGLLYLS